MHFVRALQVLLWTSFSNSIYHSFLLTPTSVLSVSPSGFSKYTDIPDSKAHGTIMEPAWALSAPDGPHIGPMNLAIRDVVILIILSSLAAMEGIKMTTSTAATDENVVPA